MTQLIKQSWTSYPNTFFSGMPLLTYQQVEVRRKHVHRFMTSKSWNNRSNTSKSWNNRSMTSKSWNNIKIFMLNHGL